MRVERLMPEPSYSDELLILVSRCYYIDNLPQAEIAKLVNVSQSSMSRMLSLARKRGLVRVSVPEYEPRYEELEQELGSRFGIDAVVIRTAPGLKGGDLRAALAFFAAPVAMKWIEPKSIVAVAGGRAMQALIERLRPKAPDPSVSIVQAMGNIDSCPGAYDAVELGRLLAKRWNARFYTLNAPGILPDAETCRQFLQLEQIRLVTEQLRSATTTFVGIGTLANSVFLERNVLAPEEIEVLRQARAVGEMLGRFFDADGNECDTDFRERVVSLPLSEVRNLPRVVAVVSGTDRADAVRSAMAAQLINTLVIDQAGAAAILGRTDTNAI